MALLQQRVVVVHGPKAVRCQRELAELPVQHVINDSWENGIASSLRAGIRALPPHCRGVLILLCDQPLIRPEHLHGLLQAWAEDPSRIVAAGYADDVGAPAVFPAHCFDALRALSGDMGARQMLHRHRDVLCTIPMQEAALDIDTQADYEALLRNSLTSG